MEDVSLAVMCCSSGLPSGGEKIGDGDGDDDDEDAPIEEPQAPWEGESQTPVAASGIIRIVKDEDGWLVPIANAEFYVSADSASLQLHGEEYYNEADYLNVVIAIESPPFGPGEYDCSIEEKAYILVTWPLESTGGSGVPTSGMTSRSDMPCNLTIESLGDVGESITGTFSGHIAGGDGTIPISGDFDVIRGNTEFY